MDKIAVVDVKPQLVLGMRKIGGYGLWETIPRIHQQMVEVCQGGVLSVLYAAPDRGHGILCGPIECWRGCQIRDNCQRCICIDNHFVQTSDKVRQRHAVLVRVEAKVKYLFKRILDILIGHII